MVSELCVIVGMTFSIPKLYKDFCFILVVVLYIYIFCALAFILFHWSWTGSDFINIFQMATQVSQLHLTNYSSLPNGLRFMCNFLFISSSFGAFDSVSLSFSVYSHLNTLCGNLQYNLRHVLHLFYD